MSLWSRLVQPWRPSRVPLPDPASDLLADLPLRRDAASTAVAEAEATFSEAMLSPVGGIIDSDDHLYRRVAAGRRYEQRDLTPVLHERMLQIAWHLIENNAMAKRLITLMADLVIGEGFRPGSGVPELADVLKRTWEHPINRFHERLRSLYVGLRINGELILPAARNPVSGIPVIGYIDPLQVQRVEMMPDNALEAQTVVLKSQAGESDGPRLAVIRENPTTGRLEGDVFYHRINALPNASRGRSDLLPLADYLDMHDQQLWAEVERTKLLSSFVFDLTMRGATEADVKKKLADLGGSLAPGSVYIHNEKESLESLSPALNAADRAEHLKTLAVFICGSMGYPITWLGYDVGTRATIEGQADVMLKTPVAFQKEFAGFLKTILRYAVEGAVGASPGLYRGLDQEPFTIDVPEIAPKDIARVGTVLSSVVSALDTAIENGTMSTKTATSVQLGVLRHLGTDIDLDTLQQEIETERAEKQAKDDERAAAVARLRAEQPRRPLAPVAAPRDDGGEPVAIP